MTRRSELQAVTIPARQDDATFSCYSLTPTDTLLLAHSSLIFVMVLGIYNTLYFLRLYRFHIFYIVWKDLHSPK